MAKASAGWTGSLRDPTAATEKTTNTDPVGFMSAASAMVAHTEDTSAVTVISAHGLRSSHAMTAPTVTVEVSAIPASMWCFSRTRRVMCLPYTPVNAPKLA